ncbi:hypothetical protein GBA52_013885 [Prunus armeniaca]|nr:hypothetical protein GBA52_013885 [Prunus armeniaca]
MALQAASVVFSAFSVPKEESPVHLSRIQACLNSSLSEPRHSGSHSIPAINKGASEGKKTLRKGSVVVTGASSGLGLATAKALAESEMACYNGLQGFPQG